MDIKEKKVVDRGVIKKGVVSTFIMKMKEL